MEIVVIIAVMWLFWSDTGNELITVFIKYLAELTQEMKDKRKGE